MDASTILALVAVAGLILQEIRHRREQPHEDANTDALTLSSLQGTLANVLASQSAALLEIEALRKDLRDATHRAESAEKRAEAAETAVIGLKKQVEDYPRRVIDLEGIIAGLREEIKRLHEASTAAATSRQMEAETASTLANTAAGQASVTPGDTTRPVQSGDNVIITAVDEPPSESP